MWKSLLSSSGPLEAAACAKAISAQDLRPSVAVGHSRETAGGKVAGGTRLLIRPSYLPC